MHDQITEAKAGCCDQLRELIANTGRSDIAIVAKRYQSLRFFAIQSRACSKEEEHLLEAAGRQVKLPLKLQVVAQIAITYCPFCGADLAKVILANENAFDRLCERHREFIL